jgi:hypothetical protein
MSKSSNVQDEYRVLISSDNHHLSLPATILPCVCLFVLGGCGVNTINKLAGSGSPYLSDNIMALLKPKAFNRVCLTVARENHPD